MKGVNDILKLGHPLLYENCAPVLESELSLLNVWVEDLSSAMNDIRQKYNFGRGIAAPQLGIMKRLIYIDMGVPRIIINPEVSECSEEMMELWDDCMSFPNLLVRVRRHKRLTLKYLDQHWLPQVWKVEDDSAELVQHEVDHLNGILCTMRAIDDRSFKWKDIPNL